MTAQPTQKKSSARRINRGAQWALLCLLLYLLVEGMSWGGLFLLETLEGITYTPLQATSLSDKHRRILSNFVNEQTNYLAFSPTLGWTIKPNGFVNPSMLYTANSQGMRGDEEYTEFPREDVLRISSFGDSFTHGTLVGNDETWQAYFARSGGGVEILNFGVIGYGLDQAYLRYEEQGVHYHSDIVLIGFMSENIYRHVNVFRPFYQSATGQPLSKPRFAMQGNSLILHPNPIQELAQYKELLSNPSEVLPGLGARDFYFQHRYQSGPFDFSPLVRLLKVLQYGLITSPMIAVVKNGLYDESSEAYRVTTKLLDRFYRSVIDHDSLPVILLFPKRGDIQQYREVYSTRYAPLMEYFDERGYRYIDLMGAFEWGETSIPVNDLFKGTHYSPLANELVADHLLRYLAKHRLLEINAVEEALRSR